MKDNILQIKDVTKIFPFAKVTGIFSRKIKQAILDEQKAKPYTSNEGVIALQHISLNISSDEFVVILGESGSGKSTLLRIVAGLEKANLGEVIFDNQDISALMPEQRDVAMVFQNYALYPHLSVYDNIAYPLANRHMPREEIDKLVMDIAEDLKIKDLLQKSPSSLSGGESQRVAIARALVRNPKMFLLDEPLSNIDEELRKDILRQLKSLHKKMNIPFLYVTHNQEDARVLADRVIVLKDGKLVQDGSLIELYDSPISIYSASLIGYPQINIYEDIPVENGTVNLLGRQYHSSKLNKYQKVTVGIRPSDIKIDNKGIGIGVDYCEVADSKLISHLTYEGKEIVVAEILNDAQIEPYSFGTILNIDIPEDKLNFFDDKGNRIS